MDMFYNYKVGIWNKGPSTKVNGITIPGVLAWVKDVMTDIQPYSKVLLLKDYGYDIECTKRVFMDADNDIKIGTVLYYTNPNSIIEKYEVKQIIQWDYIEVMCLGL